MPNLASRTAVAVCALAFAVPALARAEDLTITSTVIANGKPGRTSTTYMTAGKMKSSDGENDSIVDVKTGTMTVVDHAHKQYFVITQEDVQQAMAQMDQMLEQQKGAMANMPAGLRERMAKAMGGGDEAAVASVRADPAGDKKIAGYDTHHYVITIGTMHNDVWAAPGIVPPFNYADVLRLRSAMAAGPMMKKMSKITESMASIKGYPLATESSMMNTTVHTEATQVSRGAIPAATFEVPAGYKQSESPLKNLKMGKH